MVAINIKKHLLKIVLIGDNAGAYSEPCQTSKMELDVKIIND